MASSDQAGGKYAFLDRYGRGEFDLALADLTSGRGTRAAVRDFRSAADQWLINASAEDRSTRLSIVAAVSLELVARGAASTSAEYREVGPLIEWTCDRFRKGPASEAERLFNLGAISLLQGARDERALAGMYGNSPASHLVHATSRFPDEPRFKLARVTAYHAAQVISSRPVAPGFLVNGGAVDPEPPRAAQELDGLLANLRALGADPVVGEEAQLRRGVLLMARSRETEAVFDLQAAAQSKDSFITYLSYMMLGVAHERGGRTDRAVDEYARAARLIPATTANLALASALARVGRGQEAVDVITRWAPAIPPDDPWKLYSFRDYRLFPDQLARLRHWITR